MKLKHLVDLLQRTAHAALRVIEALQNAGGPDDPATPDHMAHVLTELGGALMPDDPERVGRAVSIATTMAKAIADAGPAGAELAEVSLGEAARAAAAEVPLGVACACGADLGTPSRHAVSCPLRPADAPPPPSAQPAGLPAAGGAPAQPGEPWGAAPPPPPPAVAHYEAASAVAPQAGFDHYGRAIGAPVAPTPPPASSPPPGVPSTTPGPRHLPPAWRKPEGK